MKKYRFFLHYNKPLSKQKKKHLWSIHYRGSCYFVENIKCNVITESKINNRQPYVVMRGYASKIIIENDTAIIDDK